MADDMIPKEVRREDGELQSPAWHGELLALTEQRLQEGKEQIFDWERAKEKLRKAFKH